MSGCFDDDNRWEQVYLEQSHDAAVGRLFRGLIHNLNGAIQAFSLHSELLGLALDQAIGLCREILARPDESQVLEKVAAIENILQKRSDSLREMSDKVRLCQAIMRSTQSLPDFQKSLGGEPYTINSAIRNEVEFLGADSFFKHKVGKELALADDLPPLVQAQVDVHQAIFVLLANALDAMRDSEAPFMRIESSRQDDMVTVVVQDSGEGIPGSILERVFEPFFTTRPSHLGMGLYLAKRIMDACCGEIWCESRPGRTRFGLVFPGNRI